MTFDALVATGLAMLVGAATPGPNNLLAIQAGAAGPRATARVIAGVVLGSVVLISVAWFGGSVVFDAVPWLRRGLAIAGAAYLGGLGLAIAMRPPRDATAAPRATSVAGIAALQVVNPKAWMIAVAVTTGPATRTPAAFAALIAIASAIPIACLAGWAAAGAALDRLAGAHRRWVDLASGGLLVASAGALLVESLP